MKRYVKLRINQEYRRLISIKSVGRKIVKTTNAEHRNSACGERIFIIQAPLEFSAYDRQIW